jgi:uncharacterized protein YegP (UPF0339 family)
MREIREMDPERACGAPFARGERADWCVVNIQNTTPMDSAYPEANGGVRFSRERCRAELWRLNAVNGRIIATSGESYVRKEGAIHGINVVMGTTHISQYMVYQGVDRLWRWRLVATNGQIIAIASESYYNKSDAEWRAGIAIGTNSNTPVEDLTRTAAA